MCVHVVLLLVGVRVHVCVHVYRGQRATFDVDPQEILSLFSEINFLTGLENSKNNRPGTSLSPAATPVLRLLTLPPSLD